MTDEISIENLSGDELGKLLTQDGGRMDKPLAFAVHEFVEDMGGPEEAEAAIAVLGELEASARCSATPPRLVH